MLCKTSKDINNSDTIYLIPNKVKHLFLQECKSVQSFQKSLVLGSEVKDMHTL